MITTPNPTPYIWTSEVFQHLGELGVFGEQRVELIEGQVLKISPMGTRHTTAVALVERQ